MTVQVTAIRSNQPPPPPQFFVFSFVRQVVAESAFMYCDFNMFLKPRRSIEVEYSTLALS